jgi:hypothetical protein
MEIARAVMARDSDLCAKLKDTPDQPDDGPVRKDRQTGS